MWRVELSIAQDRPTRARARRALGAVAVIVVGACGGKDAEHPAPQPPVAGTLQVVPPTGSSDGARVAADTGAAARGGAPRGYVAFADLASATISNGAARELVATEDGNGRWNVRPSATPLVVYSARDTVRQKRYQASGTFELLEATTSPDGFGVTIGGTSLDDTAKRQYTIVRVRGDGKFSVVVHTGASAKVLTDWTSHPSIPHADAAGKGVYGVVVTVDGGVARVRINGQPVTMFSGARTPMQGVAGVWIGSGAHLMVTPASVTR